MKGDNGVWPCVARGNNNQNKLQSSDRAAITHIALFGDCTAVKKHFGSIAMVTAVHYSVNEDRDDGYQICVVIICSNDSLG